MRSKGNHKEVLQRIIAHVASTTANFTKLKASPQLSMRKPLGILVLVILVFVFKMKSSPLQQDDVLCVEAYCENVISKKLNKILLDYQQGDG